MLNFKNISQFSNHLTETVRTAIKSKNNDIVFKMIENFTEKPDWIEDFLKVKYELT
jgi:hypothetical protein